MTTKRYTLSKEERLSWKRYIDLLFEKGQSFVAFPLRVVYLPMDRFLHCLFHRSVRMDLFIEVQESD